jgi:hypothetical protein
MAWSGPELQQWFAEPVAYLTTETLTFCIGQLIAATVSRFAFRYSNHIAAVA